MCEDRADHARSGARVVAMTADSGRRLCVILAALILLAAASCDRLLSTRISKITARPAEYQGKDVTVYGTVAERIDIPSLRCYVLSDGEERIGVVTKGRLPLVGEKVRAKGRVQQGFPIGARKLLVIIEAPRSVPTRASSPAGPVAGPG
jgi:hypothetical protein